MVWGVVDKPKTLNSKLLNPKPKTQNPSPKPEILKKAVFSALLCQVLADGQLFTWRGPRLDF